MVDLDGNLVHKVTVVIRPVHTDPVTHSRFVQTYAADPYFINGDDQLQENFAIGDVPPGTYAVSVSTTKIYQQTVTVPVNGIGWATFVVNFPDEIIDPTPQPTDTVEPSATPEEGTPPEATPEEPTPEPTAEIPATPEAL